MMYWIYKIAIVGASVFLLDACLSPKQDNDPRPVLSESAEPDVNVRGVHSEEKTIFEQYQLSLEKMEEGVLLKSEPLGEMRFRFLWFRDADKPYSVRGYKGDDGKVKLHMKALNASGPFQKDAVKSDDTFVHLTGTQSSEVIAMLDGLDLCSLISLENRKDTHSVWVFEQVRNGDYCHRVLYNPVIDEELGAHIDLGVYLLKASRVKTWEIDVY